MPTYVTQPGGMMNDAGSKPSPDHVRDEGGKQNEKQLRQWGEALDEKLLAGRDAVVKFGSDYAKSHWELAKAVGKVTWYKGKQGARLAGGAVLAGAFAVAGGIGIGLAAGAGVATSDAGPLQTLGRAAGIGISAIRGRVSRGDQQPASGRMGQLFNQQRSSWANRGTEQTITVHGTAVPARDVLVVDVDPHPGASRIPASEPSTISNNVTTGAANLIRQARAEARGAVGASTGAVYDDRLARLIGLL